MIISRIVETEELIICKEIFKKEYGNMRKLSRRGININTINDKREKLGEINIEFGANLLSLTSKIRVE